MNGADKVEKYLFGVQLSLELVVLLTVFRNRSVGIMTKNAFLVACCALLVMALPASSSPIEVKAKTLVRVNRGIMDWKIFGGSTTKAPETTTAAPLRPNHIEIGNCEDDDKVSEVTFV